MRETTTVGADATDVILRDGSTLRLRAPAASDAGALLALFGGLSQRSLYRRFNGLPRLNRALVEPYLDPDWAEKGALMGILDERVVALGNYARLRDRTGAEAAFAVADDLQGRGIGTRLLEQLAARAASEGIEWFVAQVMAENAQMLSVFTSAGFEVARELESGEIEVRFPIAPTEQLRARVDERDHVAVVASLRPFFEPESVAVVGASRRRGSIGGELFRNMLEADFSGSVYPINRNGEPVAGVHAYRSVAEIGSPVDLAVICVPGAQVLAAAESALRAGVRALCVISSGFAEMGAGGRELEERLLAVVREHGARLVGPNCLGIAEPSIGLNATFAPRGLPPGRIAMSSQSGALGLALLEKAAERNLGFSSFVSIGNKADVSSNDLLEWWEEDDGSDVVLLYLESFGNPRKFGRLARRVARSKPILALKAGTASAGARAASSHTAALAGSEVAVDALFRDAGVLRARTLEELVDAAALFASQPAPAGRRVGVVTNAGGLGILCADACEASGLELPMLTTQTQHALSHRLPREASIANPVDLLGSATADTYEAVLPLLLADAHVDALIVLFVPPVVASADDVAYAIRRAVETAATAKPVLAVVMSADGTPPVLLDPYSPVATFPYPESAARALGLAAERADWLRRPAGSVPTLAEVDADRARHVIANELAESNETWLDARGTRAVLEAFGIRLVGECVVTTADDAVSAAHELGYPVVVKSSAPGAHKTESGAIALDLRDDAGVRAATDRIGPPVLVQPQVEGGTELLAGVVQDPVFGPLVAFGPGGVFAELIGGANVRTAPLTDIDAEGLVDEGKAGVLVRGFRGAAAADRGSLVDLVHRLGRLAEELPEVVELDLNPVIAHEDGCVAVDARIRVKARPAGRSVKGW